MRFLPQGVTGAANVPMDADFLFCANRRGWVDTVANLIRSVCLNSFSPHRAARQQNQTCDALSNSDVPAL